ncbi:MAG: ribose-phosphate pyrophosphokinase [Puniceicoccales bacterium]|jgi:ribose-phosphate pyrophosphokinase|nr:ribose-phosphate pyrophosphokinase [Puniceicoccales bacterium]
MKIFSGTSHPAFAQGICDYLRISLGAIELSTFPDGETFVQIRESVRGCDVFIIQGTHFPAHHHAMEMFIMVDAIRRASAARITAVLPYFGYGRQDRKDRPRVPVTAKLMANLLTSAGANRLLTMDLHAPQIAGFFDIPVDHLSAAPTLLGHIRKQNYGDVTICSPDAGGMGRATTYADAMNGPLAQVVKRRSGGAHAEAVDVIGDVAGRDILLVDDTTETAETLTTAAKLLKEKGALAIRAAVSHAPLTALGQENLRNSAIDSLLTTNSTPTPFDASLPITKLDICPLFAEAIRKIHGNGSLAELFEINKF